MTPGYRQCDTRIDTSIDCHHQTNRGQRGDRLGAGRRRTRSVQESRASPTRGGPGAGRSLARGITHIAGQAENRWPGRVTASAGKAISRRGNRLPRISVTAAPVTLLATPTATRLWTVTAWLRTLISMAMWETLREFHTQAATGTTEVDSTPKSAGVDPGGRGGQGASGGRCTRSPLPEPTKRVP